MQSPTVGIVDSGRRLSALLREPELAAKVERLEGEGVDLRAVVLQVFDAAVSEASTDALIGKITRKVPGIGPLVLGPVLDALLPGVLRSLVVELLERDA